MSDASSDQKVSLAIGHDEALLLFELLADFDYQVSLELPSVAERLALMRLHGALEKVLVEPFAANYEDLLNKARLRLANQAGRSE